MSVSNSDTPLPFPASTATSLANLPHVRTWMEFLFALLSAGGGLVLATGQGAEGIAVIAVFMAVIGFVFVDWLRVFHLPAPGAYLAMGASAAYCVRDFWQIQQGGAPQMSSVALLLVLVQAVLMLQHKSRRIVEQLAVFCLLQLVVAAIFSDAIHFGLLVIPIAIVGGLALSLLALVTNMESIEVTLQRNEQPEAATAWQRFVRYLAGDTQPSRPPHPVMVSASAESAFSLYRSAGAWSRFAIVALTPAIVLVAAAFFFALPRRINPSRASATGPAMVGFDDEIRLEQLGQVMQNPKKALKVKLTDRVTGKPYTVNGSLYLRGKVLEKYRVSYANDRPIAKWISSDQNSLSRRGKLPRDLLTESEVKNDSFDDVDVAMTCESMSRPALFSIAPYYDDNRADDVEHSSDHWTLSRKSVSPPFPRKSYGFTTRAFSAGRQSAWLPQTHGMDSERLPPIFDFEPFLRGRGKPKRRKYYVDLLRFDRSAVPTASVLANQIVEAIPRDQRSPARIARDMESFLSTDVRFQYTLDLSSKPIRNTDPIEQFLAVDRRGHCQYFASSLAMMLRSVHIPCRVVVGYRTEEYNGVGKYYIARQEHAHAWVEALIDRREIPSQIRLPGEARTQRYWLRLDPTPGVSREDDGNATGVGGVVDLANNLWEDYVVEMDSERQSDELVEVAGLKEVRASYAQWFESAKRTLEGIRSGEIDGSDLRPKTSLPLLPIGGVAAVILTVLMLPRLKVLNWLAGRPAENAVNERARSSLKFYEQTLRQLERVGIQRRSDETPAELMFRVGDRFPNLATLTDFFQRGRYGSADLANEPAKQHVAASLEALTENVDQRVQAET